MHICCSSYTGTEEDIGWQSWVCGWGENIANNQVVTCTWVYTMNHTDYGWRVAPGTVCICVRERGWRGGKEREGENELK